MKRTMLMLIPAVVLVIACGEQPQESAAATALDVLPESSLFSMALINPAAMISALDGYAAGVAVLGENAISGWILSGLDCADMSEVDTKLGIKSDGSLVLFMESMMPQSFGAAISVSDPDIFWANLGIVPQPGEPVDGYDVTTIPVDFGNIYFCHTDGMLLASGSRAGLQSMLGRIDGQVPESIPDIPDGSLYLYTNVESFGPMIASQLSMMQPQILGEMSVEGEMDQAFMQNIMGFYFDALSLVLTDTKSYTCILNFGPEYITGNSTVEFIPGSTLDSYIIPTETQDLTGMVPAGDVMVGRVSLDPATSMAVMNAVLGAMEIQDIPQDMVEFWAQTARNTAMSMVVDPENPLHVFGVYEMPQGSTLEDVKNAYDIQFQLLSQVMQMQGLLLRGVDYAEYQGLQWITFGMDMDMSAMQPESLDTPMAGGTISWTAWLTAQDGVLYMEMAPEPVTVVSIIDGSFQGSTVAEMPEMQEMSETSEIAFLLNLPGYLNMAMGMSGLDVPPIESDDVWIQVEVDLVEGGMNQSFSVSGTGMSAFIGNAIQMFGAIAAE